MREPRRFATAEEITAACAAGFRFLPDHGPAEFLCSDCQQWKAIPLDGTSCGTGYGHGKQGELVCYACCGTRDAADMEREGRATLYLTYDRKHPEAAHVSNWPGSLVFAVSRVKTGYHNIARNRYDVWFRDASKREWHGVTFGDMTQICHCRRLAIRKRKAKQ